MAQAILTDIEGTTSSIDFVHQVLFPHARRAMPDFLRARAGEPEVAALLARFEGAGLEAVIATLDGWMAEDRKETTLKALQGLIWEQGYRDGRYRGHVYPDAVAGLRRWQAAGKRLYVYSSGSVQAQRLLFGFSEAGDLTPLFDGYFDTTVGAKRERASYTAIAERIGLPPGQILFLSDITAELDAATEAGLQTTLLARDGCPPTSVHPCTTTFDTIEP